MYILYSDVWRPIENLPFFCLRVGHIDAWALIPQCGMGIV